MGELFLILIILAFPTSASGRVALLATTSRLIVHWDYLDPGRMVACSFETAARSTSDTGNRDDDLSVHQHEDDGDVERRHGRYCRKS